MLGNCCEDSGIDANSTPLLTKLLALLWVLFIVQLLLGAFQCLFISFSAGFFILLLSAFLYFAYNYRNYSLCVLYVLWTCMDQAFTVLTLGTYAAGQRNKSGDVLHLLVSLKIPFAMVATWFTFLTYRELKALTAARGPSNAPGYSAF